MLVKLSSEHLASSGQEAFVVSIHGTLIRISTIYFPEDYVQAVIAGDGGPLPSVAYYRLSEPWDLKDVNGRIEAARSLIGLMRYLKSGESLIGEHQWLYAYNLQIVMTGLPPSSHLTS
jgi:hypothetical protein